MKRISILFSMLFFCGLMTVMAQYRGLNPKVLAEMLVKEKKAGVVDDTTFLAYLDSIGFQQTNERGAKAYAKTVGKGGRAQTVKVAISQMKKNGKVCHSLKITTDNHDTWWWMVVQLRDFGMKSKEQEGAYMDLEGNGLFAGTSMNNINLGCWIEETK